LEWLKTDVLVGIWDNFLYHILVPKAVYFALDSFVTPLVEVTVTLT